MTSNRKSRFSINRAQKDLKIRRDEIGERDIREVPELLDKGPGGLFWAVLYKGKKYFIPWLDRARSFAQIISDALRGWDDLQVPASSIRLPTVNPAGEVAYKDSIVLEFADSSDEYVYFNAQLPHAWKSGTSIEFHVHYTIDTDGSGSGTENIKFDFTYSWANIGDSWPASSSLTVTTDVQDASADVHTVMELGTLGGQDKQISSIILCSLKRDTTVANNYSGHVLVASMDFHIIKDSIGSRGEYVK